MLQIKSLSYWEQRTYFDDLDFTIIGSGIVGYSTALNLRKKYPTAKILIVERGYLPAGASSKNAGFACFGSASELYEDLKTIPEEIVWDTFALRWEGLRQLKETLGIQSIDYHQFGSWDLIQDNQSELPSNFIDYLNEKAFSITGEKSIYSEDLMVSDRFLFKGIKTSYRNKIEGQIDTGKMNHQFHKLALSNNIMCLFGVEIKAFESHSNKVLITSSVGEFSTKKLAICTNGFASQFINEDVKPARAQVLVTEKIPNLPFKGTFHMENGYYYFRNIDQRILFGGGRNLDIEAETTTQIGTSDLIQANLEERLRTFILPNKSVKIEYRWAGIMGIGKTKSPIIKCIHPNVCIGVRMGGMGVAIGSEVGKSLSKLF
jgi:glycine/D-amino acid oxidase-like deaminating enzyme